MHQIINIKTPTPTTLQLINPQNPPPQANGKQCTNSFPFISFKNPKSKQENKDYCWRCCDWSVEIIMMNERKQSTEVVFQNVLGCWGLSTYGYTQFPVIECNNFVLIAKNVHLVFRSRIHHKSLSPKKPSGTGKNNPHSVLRNREVFIILGSKELSTS